MKILNALFLMLVSASVFAQVNCMETPNDPACQGVAPEPSTLALLGVGAAVALGYAIKNRKK